MLIYYNNLILTNVYLNQNYVKYNINEILFRLKKLP